MSEMPRLPSSVVPIDDGINPAMRAAFEAIFAELTKPRAEIDRDQVITHCREINRLIGKSRKLKITISDYVMTVMPAEFRGSFLDIFLLTIVQSLK